ncbi:MAG: XRE family transcriptional regulator [Burkholderiaceae bacterium]|jgi:transcriptional regulator with XRE-family HTH domain|uniref:XRE family transcriptional regulator n=1 Tax=Cupriavidus metallidurans TaxID=119219 RepID=A0A2L0X1B8_9BURK|nr:MULTISPECIES: helix-turn-helix transcriptional regulator [Cupriavidus]PCH57822.1 MAG: XRE family transcriptional regulator [Burkholderiaceae bacterium]AVA33907.1 XRE family transcriptional regulator [Cupriavidus metallidurans]KWR83978.1 XRE family transcriptional regulator [Cupriavidus sp. SHE]QBP12687.1 XRE family transcriptional regulator [Cupriavidus metallidurans]QWC90472.1 helix-turn-helix transcriptional regulator [Cupriavidus metallidurans]
MDTLTPGSEAALDFPGLLRYWRGKRGYSQLALSLAAGVSQRHISFLESGRARPSREMVLALAERLGVPLRQRNRLLLASGYAPAYSEHALASPPMQMVRHAIALILAKQEPYPAVVLDRFWHLVDANQAYRRMLDKLLQGRKPATLDEAGGRLNLMLAVFDPNGLWPVIENARQVGRYLLRRVWQELQVQAQDQTAREILRRIAEWHPDMVGAGGVLLVEDDPAEGTPPPVLPVALHAGRFRASLFSTLTTLGIPQDVTLQELRIECFYPADDATKAVFEALAEVPANPLAASTNR